MNPAVPSAALGDESPGNATESTQIGAGRPGSRPQSALRADGTRSELGTRPLPTGAAMLAFLGGAADGDKVIEQVERHAPEAVVLART